MCHINHTVVILTAYAYQLMTQDSSFFLLPDFGILFGKALGKYTPDRFMIYVRFRVTLMYQLARCAQLILSNMAELTAVTVTALFYSIRIIVREYLATPEFQQNSSDDSFMLIKCKVFLSQTYVSQNSLPIKIN